LERDVFNAIADRLVVKCDDLALLTWTWAGFEEWLNAEAYLACCHRWGFHNVTCRPRYSAWTNGRAGGSGDLAVERAGGGSVFSEIKLIHDGWFSENALFDMQPGQLEQQSARAEDALSQDAQKLAAPFARETARLQIVAISTLECLEIEKSANWRKVFARVTQWNRPTDLIRMASLLVENRPGQFIAKAWTVQACEGQVLTR